MDYKDYALLLLAILFGFIVASFFYIRDIPMLYRYALIGVSFFLLVIIFLYALNNLAETTS